LTIFSCYTNQLTSLDVRNGNNTLFTYFWTVDNPNLTCISVDDATWSTTNWTNIDAASSFSLSCNPMADHFVTTWSGSSGITIPTFSGETYNYDVDWDNDGTFDEFGITSDVTHDYGVVGTYTIRVQGVFPRIYFNNTGMKNNIRSIDQWGNISWSSMAYSFFGCNNLVSNAIDAPDLSNVTDLTRMFSFATLFDLDLSAWNTSNITTMWGMFWRSDNFNNGGQPLNWDTSSVTDMSYMFLGAGIFNQDIGTWNTSLVTNMTNMFNSSRVFNQDIGGWDTSNVTRMDYMFYWAENFNQNIDNWDTSNVANMKRMFTNATAFNQNINSWDTSSVTDMSGMFSQTANFNGNIISWDTSAVTDVNSMFSTANSFNQDIGSWNTTNVTNMQWMFNQAFAFNNDISSWVTTNVTNMNGMFRNASSFDQNIGGWSVENVADFTNMFQSVTLSNANYDALLIGWDAQTLLAGKSFHGGNSQYCSVAAESARANMIASDTWSIVDGGPCAALGVEDFEALNITMFPNPTVGSFTITLESEAKYSLISLTGQLVKEGNLSNGNNTIGLTELPAGLYFLTVETDKGRATQKVIKQ